MRITLPLEAPDKPAFGAPCNGCGVCCLAELCPLGRLVYRRKTGPCPSLVWKPEDKRHFCGLATGPFSFLTRRWIAAGIGCDSDAVIEP